MAFVVEVGLYLYFFGEEKKGKMNIMGQGHWRFEHSNTGKSSNNRSCSVGLGISSLYLHIVLTIFLQIQHILCTLSSRRRKRNLVNLQGHRASLEVESTVRICSLGDSGDLRTRQAPCSHKWYGTNLSLGFYILFTHMIKQRRRIMRGKGRARE